jgi:plasmid stability protein
VSDIGTDPVFHEEAAANFSAFRAIARGRLGLDWAHWRNHNGCMASITLKSLPVSLHRALKTRAARHKRSLNSEVIATLENSVAADRPIDIQAILAKEAQLLSKLNNLKVWATPEEIDRFKREGRE